MENLVTFVKIHQFFYSNIPISVQLSCTPAQAAVDSTGYCWTYIFCVMYQHGVPPQYFLSDVVSCTTCLQVMLPRQCSHVKWNVITVWRMKQLRDHIPPAFQKSSSCCAIGQRLFAILTVICSALVLPANSVVSSFPTIITWRIALCISLGRSMWRCLLLLHIQNTKLLVLCVGTVWVKHRKATQLGVAWLLDQF